MASEPDGARAVAQSPGAMFLLRLLAVFVLGLLIVYLLWWPLGLPARILNDVTSGIGPESCEMYLVGTSEMTRCATTVGAKKVIGPLLVGLAMFVLRKQIGKAMKWLEHSKPVRGLDGRLGMPLLSASVPAVAAIVLFTMGWAAIHDATKAAEGYPLFNQQRFPILVGLFTLASTHFGPAIMKAAAGFYRKRDRFKLWMRIAFVGVAGVLVSYLIMTQSGGSQSYLEDPGLKEQTVVLFSLILGWAMLTPVPKAPAAAAAPLVSPPPGLGSPAPVPQPGARR